jgi:hypothetical protein
MLVAVPKPVRKIKEPKRWQTRTRLVTKTPVKPVNHKRAKGKRERNYPPRTGHEQCAIAVKAATMLGRIPADWRGCEGSIEAAHVVHTRGMGGCGSSKDEVVYLCTAHHGEQEGRSAAFEARYGVDLRELAAEQAESNRR